jgi:hypothetical protein
MSKEETFHDIIQRYKPKLDDIFYNDNFQYRSLPKFIDKIKEEHFNVPTQIIKDYYDNQNVVQVFKPYTEEKQYHPILSYYPFERVYIDTMYLTLTKSVIAFVNIMDLFSKYAFSKFFIIPAGTSNIPSSKSKEAFIEFLDTIPKGFTIGIVNSDRGSEYQGSFHSFLEEKNIIQSYSNVGDHLKQSPIERFNKTLRLMIEKYRVINSNINKDALKSIIDAYNNTVHSKYIYTPNQILGSEKYQNQISAYNNELKVLYNSDVIVPLTGYVRVLLEQKAFQKVKPVWSTKIYKILHFKYGNYSLEGLDKLYKRNELQPVIKDYIMGEKLKVDVEEPVIDDRIKKIDSNKLLDSIKSPRKKREVKSTKRDDFEYG